MARPHMNASVCAFSETESLVAAAQSLNHPSYDDQWYFNEQSPNNPVIAATAAAAAWAGCTVTLASCQYQCTTLCECVCI